MLQRSCHHSTVHNQRHAVLFCIMSEDHCLQGGQNQEVFVRQHVKHFGPLVDCLPIYPCYCLCAAGKSSLIKAMKRAGGTAGTREPTIAPMPGTTLGLLQVPGIPLGPKRRTFDTPGVHHPYQLTSKLNLEELQMVLPRKALKARTYRIPGGKSVLLGGLVQVDVLKIPGSTIYLTVFASNQVSLHMGKTEGAEERRIKHVGGLLVPPLTADRMEQLGPLVPHGVVVEGTTWDKHTEDIGIAGMYGR